MKIKVGLMLGGGGAKGGYQLGVIRALQEANLIDKIDCIAGTSIGAINGFLLMTLNDANKMSEVWQIAQSKNPIKQKSFRINQDREGLYSLDILREVFEHYIDEKKVKNAKIDTFVVAAKIVDPKKIASQIRMGNHEKSVFHLNDHPNAFDAVIASASIPLFFGTTYIEGEAYVDGGLVDNNPIDILLEQGCNVILSVPLDHGFNFNQFANHKVLFINFTDFNVFSSLPLLDAYDIIRFTEESIEERNNYGYLVATDIIQKLRDQNILKRSMFGMTEQFVRVDKFTYFEAPIETYQKIKQLKKERKITHKEHKKRQSIHEKIMKKVTRGE